MIPRSARNDTPITIAGWLFVVVGCVSLVSHVWRYATEVSKVNASVSRGQELTDLTFVAISALAAILGGVFVLRGRSWARWLLVVWMGAHVAISLTHSRFELAVHAVFFVIVLAVFASPRASAYFAREAADDLPPLPR